MRQCVVLVLLSILLLVTIVSVVDSAGIAPGNYEVYSFDSDCFYYDPAKAANISFVSDGSAPSPTDPNNPPGYLRFYTSGDTSDNAELVQYNTDANGFGTLDNTFQVTFRALFITTGEPSNPGVEAPYIKIGIDTTDTNRNGFLYDKSFQWGLENGGDYNGASPYANLIPNAKGQWYTYTLTYAGSPVWLFDRDALLTMCHWQEGSPPAYDQTCTPPNSGPSCSCRVPMSSSLNSRSLNEWVNNPSWPVAGHTYNSKLAGAKIRTIHLAMGSFNPNILAYIDQFGFTVNGQTWNYTFSSAKHQEYIAGSRASALCPCGPNDPALLTTQLVGPSTVTRYSDLALDLTVTYTPTAQTPPPASGIYNIQCQISYDPQLFKFWSSPNSPCYTYVNQLGTPKVLCSFFSPAPLTPTVNIGSSSTTQELTSRVSFKSIAGASGDALTFSASCVPVASSGCHGDTTYSATLALEDSCTSETGTCTDCANDFVIGMDGGKTALRVRATDEALFACADTNGELRNICQALDVLGA